ncbi:MAG: 50S ribosome-binding GTPase [Sedimentisphaerales bacterium]|nr:50S ribosome-binding GTPase [Sedimentisphaerales bacterium]
MTGPDAIAIVQELFSFSVAPDEPGIRTGSITIDPQLSIDASLYLFLAPHSYTGEDTAEIHLEAGQAIVEGLMETLLANPLRGRNAGPGEFTARAYLNGKIDLSQAEAVNEIITCSNRFQLAAAEKLLAGRLTQATEEILAALMDCLSLIETGLDFSTEDIELITCDQTVERLERIKQMLERLLADSIHYESVADLPAVGIAGSPGAGKSSLLNRLLTRPRSIVSGRRKTTRDVLTDVLILTNCRCVIFDCAGLLEKPDNILDELAHQAAVEALEKASVVVFCIDISKTDWTEDVAVRKFIKDDSQNAGQETRIIPIATKSDLLSEDALAKCLAEINGLFAADFLPTSAKAGTGMEHLREAIDGKIIEIAIGSGKRGTSLIALTARHRQAVTEAIKNVSESIKEIKAGNDEVAAMLLRSAYQSASHIQQQHIDEQILEEIFSRFCIGK